MIFIYILYKYVCYMQRDTFVYNFAFVLLIILVVFSFGFMVGKTKYYYIHIYENFS